MLIKFRGYSDDMDIKQIPMRELALFAGAGGGILGGKLLGWRTVCAVERDAYPAAVLAQRQNDGLLENFPIWSDVETFDGTPWRGIVDVVSGGFPCQDISVAGKGAGISGERSGLWREMRRIICDVQPKWVFVENSTVLTSRGLGTVLGDLAALGYDAEWTVLSAEEVGAPHRRARIWILAKQNGRYENVCNEVSDAVREGLSITRAKSAGAHGIEIWRSASTSDWWDTEPDVGRVVNGLANRVDRIKALGNGQVPLCAAVAFSELYNRFFE